MRARMRIPPEYVRLHVSCAAPLHATWRLRIARTLTGGVGDDLSGGRPPERYRLVSEQLAFALSRTHAALALPSPWTRLARSCARGG